MKHYIAIALLVLSGCATPPGKTMTFGPPRAESTRFETPPAESTTFETPSAESTITELPPSETTTIIVKWKSYDEVWDASIEAVRRHLLIVEQNKEGGVIKAKEDRGASQNTVEVFINPSASSDLYTVDVESRNADSGASYSQRPIIAAEIKQTLQGYGTIGLVSARFNPPVEIGEIAEGKGHTALSGLVAGAKTGAKPGAVVAYVGAKGNQPLVAGFGIMLSAAGAVVGGVAGSVAGAFKGDSAQTIQQKETQARAILTGLNVQEKMRDGIAQYAKEHDGPTLVKLSDRSPVSLDEEVNYGDLSAQKIDTVFEITVTSYGIRRIENQDADRVLVVFINARARLVRTKTNSVLVNNSFVYQSAAKNFSEWSANNGKPVAEALADACQHIASQVSDSFF